MASAGSVSCRDAGRTTRTAATTRHHSIGTAARTNRRSHQRAGGCWLAMPAFIVWRSSSSRRALVSLGEEAGKLVGGNGAFTNGAPASGLVAEIGNGGSNVARRGTAIDNDVDAALELV